MSLFRTIAEYDHEAYDGADLACPRCGAKFYASPNDNAVYVGNVAHVCCPKCGLTEADGMTREQFIVELSGVLDHHDWRDLIAKDPEATCRFFQSATFPAWVAYRNALSRRVERGAFTDDEVFAVSSVREPIKARFAAVRDRDGYLNLALDLVTE